MDDQSWHFYEAFFGTIKLADGQTASAPCELMRRRNEHGDWEYRRMSDNEEADYAASRAW